MIEAIQSTDLRRRVKQVLDQVRTKKQPVIVNTYDTPQAVIIPYEDYLDYQAWQTRQAQQSAWLVELQAIAEEVSGRVDLSEGALDNLIDEAVQAANVP
ncbi:MAG: type II toxin-antitoxin system Phd/YefM family antitoxin [Anaerolineae bacterium]|nr:type II toxin-antitoxin system Phd/YefM family antitoxin [Anaerolineae bacterium]